MNNFQRTNDVFRDPRVLQQSYNAPNSYYAVPPMPPSYPVDGRYQSHIPQHPQQLQQPQHPQHPHPYFRPQPQPQPYSTAQGWHSSGNQGERTTHTILHGGGPGGHLQFPSNRIESKIIQIGEGETVAGQSTEDFNARDHTELCYQCCKWAPLGTLISTREQLCGASTCNRCMQAGLEYICMPQNAAEACRKFQTFLDWWMGKVGPGVDESIEMRARRRVLEVRAEIP